MKKIAIEEHFLTEDYVNYLCSRKDPPKLEIVEDEKHNEIVRLWNTPTDYTVQKPEEWYRKLDVGEDRLREMDEDGIDVQVLSLASAVEMFEPPEGTTQAKKTNDDLAKIVQSRSMIR